jgi:hypothetical protein
MIKDSGNRSEFETGAVRDIQVGKGRCDLIPLDVVASIISHYGPCGKVIDWIYEFTKEGNTECLNEALLLFGSLREWDVSTMMLEVAIHFEEGAEKYGENNWQKGLPAKSYINSAVRHYLKWMRGDDDERHDRAFCWNIMCCIWTCLHKPELVNYTNTEGGESK